MKNSSRFFSNKDCEYYPCHGGIEEINCLFCYCPLYPRRACPGSPRVIQTARGSVKDCSGCTFPHRPENYEVILQWLRKDREDIKLI